MNLTKMRHQLERARGQALIINGLHYGWTTLDVLRNRERPMLAEVTRRARGYAEAWAEIIRMVLPEPERHDYSNGGVCPCGALLFIHGQEADHPLPTIGGEPVLWGAFSLNQQGLLDRPLD